MHFMYNTFGQFDALHQNIFVCNVYVVLMWKLHRIVFTRQMDTHQSNNSFKMYAKHNINVCTIQLFL